MTDRDEQGKRPPGPPETAGMRVIKGRRPDFHVVRPHEIDATREAVVAFYLRRVVVTGSGQGELRRPHDPVLPDEVLVGDVVRASTDPRAPFSVTALNDIPGHNIDSQAFADPEAARDALVKRYQSARLAGSWPA